MVTPNQAKTRCDFVQAHAGSDNQNGATVKEGEIRLLTGCSLAALKATKGKNKVVQVRWNAVWFRLRLKHGTKSLKATRTQGTELVDLFHAKTEEKKPHRVSAP